MIRVSRFLLLVAATSLAGCGPSSGTPEYTLYHFFHAIDDLDAGTLEEVWFISTDPEIRTAVIDQKLKSVAFDRALDRHAGRAIKALEAKGQIGGVGSAAHKPPDRSTIERAVADGRYSKNGTRLYVTLPGRRGLNLRLEGDDWWVEHSFVTVNRDWTTKEKNFYRDLNDLYSEHIEEIKTSSMVNTEIGLRLTLGAFQSERSKLMRKYDIPLLVM